MEELRDRSGERRETPFCVSIDAIEKENRRRFPRKYYKRLRQESDDILMAVETLMLEGPRKIVEGELAERVKALPNHVDYLLWLVECEDTSYSQPLKPAFYGFTAKWVIDNVIDREQERLLRAGHYPGLISVPEAEGPSNDIIELPDISNRFWTPESKAS